MSDVQSLVHTKWNCKYHVVFAPKYRRQVFYGEKKREIGEILRRLCEWKGVTPIRNAARIIHMLLENTTQDECVGIYGVSEGVKQPDAANDLAIRSSNTAIVNSGAGATTWIR